MTNPEALTPEEERHERDDHGPTVSSPEGTFCGGCDYRWPCPSARLLATLDAERAARQTPDTSGLREALAKADALAEQDEYAKDDHGGCAALDAYRDLSRALRAALAATERPLDVTTLVTDTATGDQWRVPTRAVEAIVAALDATKEAE